MGIYERLFDEGLAELSSDQVVAVVSAIACVALFDDDLDEAILREGLRASPWLRQFGAFTFDSAMAEGLHRAKTAFAVGAAGASLEFMRLSGLLASPLLREKVLAMIVLLVMDDEAHINYRKLGGLLRLGEALEIVDKRFGQIVTEVSDEAAKETLR